MTPFQQFRVWLRQGPTGQRAAAGLAALVALGLLAWAIIPSNQPSTPTLVGQPPPGVEPTLGTAPGSPVPLPTGVTAVPTPGSTAVPTGAAPGGTVGPGVASPTGRPTAGEAANPCAVQLRATDQGVSPKEIFVAVPVISLAGEAGNSTFGIRTPSDYQRMSRAITAGINSEGGVACRTMRIRTWEVNPLDPVDQQRKCQQIIDAKPFSVVDAGGYLAESSRQCFHDAKIPYQPATSFGDEAAARVYPYMYGARASADRAARNWVFEAPVRGWFDSKKGFRMLGVLFDECFPKVNAELIANLHRVGVSDQEMSVFRLSGCSAINPPAELSAAVAQHRRANASHVLLNGNGANSQEYTRQADGIGFKPQYLTSDYENETEPTLAPDFSAGFDGAIAITSLRAGERNSGIVAPWVTHCNAWLKRAGVAPSLKEEDQAPVAHCDQLRLFAAAANAAGPNLVRATLVEGLARVGRFEGGMNPGINDYDRRGEVSAGDFIRAIRWHVSCKCWKVVDRNFKPGH